MTFKPLFRQITILSLSFVTFRVSCFHVSHLTHETFKLSLQNTLNMSKTTRVYFGVLQIRARIGMICRGCKLEISRILLTMDLRIMNMSEFDVILRMDWLTAYRVVIDCERRRVTAYTQDGTRIVFQGDKHGVLPQTVYESRCQGQLAGWIASLTLEDEVRLDLDLPQVVCEYEDVFPDELLGLPPQRVVDFGIKLHPGTSPISMTPHRMAPVELQELRV